MGWKRIMRGLYLWTDRWFARRSGCLIYVQVVLSTSPGPRRRMRRAGQTGTLVVLTAGLGMAHITPLKQNKVMLCKPPQSGAGNAVRATN